MGIPWGHPADKIPYCFQGSAWGALADFKFLEGTFCLLL